MKIRSGFVSNSSSSSFIIEKTNDNKYNVTFDLTPLIKKEINSIQDLFDYLNNDLFFIEKEFVIFKNEINLIIEKINQGKKFIIINCSNEGTENIISSFLYYVKQFDEIELLFSDKVIATFI